MLNEVWAVHSLTINKVIYIFIYVTITIEYIFLLGIIF
jgi:hypothetical protein